MLSVPTEYPNPGSQALLGECIVTIVQHCADGRTLVTGEGQRRRTVARADLAPVPARRAVADQDQAA